MFGLNSRVFLENALSKNAVRCLLATAAVAIQAIASAASVSAQPVTVGTTGSQYFDVPQQLLDECNSSSSSPSQTMTDSGLNGSIEAAKDIAASISQNGDSGDDTDEMLGYLLPMTLFSSPGPNSDYLGSAPSSGTLTKISVGVGNAYKVGDDSCRRMGSNEVFRVHVRVISPRSRHSYNVKYTQEAWLHPNTVNEIQTPGIGIAQGDIAALYVTKDDVMQKVIPMVVARGTEEDGVFACLDRKQPLDCVGPLHPILETFIAGQENQSRDNDRTKQTIYDNDQDGVPNSQDNCPDTANPDQADSDGDGVGDVCDSSPNDTAGDYDNDGKQNTEDNCPTTYNPNQEDRDNDGIGDNCDDSWSGDNGGDGPPPWAIQLMRDLSHARVAVSLTYDDGVSPAQGAGDPFKIEFLSTKALKRKSYKRGNRWVKLVANSNRDLRQVDAYLKKGKKTVAKCVSKLEKGKLTKKARGKSRKARKSARRGKVAWRTTCEKQVKKGYGLKLKVSKNLRKISPAVKIRRKGKYSLVLEGYAKSELDGKTSATHRMKVK